MQLTEDGGAAGKKPCPPTDRIQESSSKYSSTAADHTVGTICCKVTPVYLKVSVIFSNHFFIFLLQIRSVNFISLLEILVDGFNFVANRG